MGFVKMVIHIDKFGGERVAFGISSDSTYEQFVSKLASELCVDLRRFDLKIKFVVKCNDGINHEPIDMVIRSASGFQYLIEDEGNPKNVVVQVLRKDAETRQAPNFVYPHEEEEMCGVATHNRDEAETTHNLHLQNDEREENVADDEYLNVGLIGDEGARVREDTFGIDDIDVDDITRIPSPIENFMESDSNTQRILPNLSGQFSNFDWNEDNDVMRNICEDGTEPLVGVLALHGMFHSKEDMIAAIGQYALDNRFSHEVVRSDKERFEATCKNAKDCSFLIRARSSIGSKMWFIHKFVKSHTCLQTVQQSHTRKVSAATLSRLWSPRVVGAEYTPNHVIKEMQQNYGVQVGYTKAWRALQSARDIAFGTPQDSYTHLSSYFYMLERANSGSVTRIDTIDGHFLRSFCALGQMIEGFKSSMRPVIVIDATHLKGVYQGKIFAAVCADGNEQIFPLAIGFGNEECNDTWEWFLWRLKEAFGEPNDLVIVSDRHAAIHHAVRVVYPGVPHVFCYRHMKENIHKHCRDPQVLILFKQAMYTYEKEKCDQYLAEIQQRNKKVYAWLVSVVKLEAWSRAYCPKRRYNHMTSNFVESFNEAIKKSRKMPITAAHEFFRTMCQKWFNERREKANAMGNHISTYAVTRIETEAAKNDQVGLQVTAIRMREEYIVCHTREGNAIVNLMRKSCSCRKWDLDLIPCVHAIAAAREAGVHYFTLCNGVYFDTEVLKKVYSPSINPVPEGITLSNNIAVVQPPMDTSRGVGRPHDARFPSYSERFQRRTKKCSVCQSRGHNRKTCPNVASSSSSSIPIEDEPVHCSPVPTEESQVSGCRRKCSSCGQIGHTRRSRKCPVQRTNNTVLIDQATDGNDDDDDDDEDGEDDDCVQGIAEHATGDEGIDLVDVPVRFNP